MINKDVLNQKNADIFAKMQTAIKNNDTEGFTQAWNEYAVNIQEVITQEARGLIDAQDVNVLNARGVRQLTSEENKYYKGVIQAMKSANPQQALSELDVVLPKTTIDAVFEELEQTHPLLDAIQFQNTSGLIEYLMNTNEKQLAAWGTLTSEIVKELTSGFKKVDMRQNKLSAWMPVAKSMLDLGPVWLDRYVRIVLSEALAYGLEEAIMKQH